MHYAHPFLAFCRTSVLLGTLWAAVPVAANTITVGGTGSGLGVARILGDAYQAIHPDARIVVVPALGSSGGIKAVAVGALDIGLSGRPLKPSERAQRLYEQEIARTPLVLVSMQPHPGFTRDEIAQIYSGSLRTWPDGTPLRPILRPDSDTESAILRLMSPEIDRALTVAYARPGVHTAITDQDSADAVEHVPGAVGTSSLALIVSEQRKMKALRIDGVMPSVAALARGRYPYFKPLYIVTPHPSSESVKDFVAFIRSPHGLRVLSNNGFLALKSGEK